MIEGYLTAVELARVERDRAFALLARLRARTQAAEKIERAIEEWATEASITYRRLRYEAENPSHGGPGPDLEA